jgi:hypothetical protein
MASPQQTTRSARLGTVVLVVAVVAVVALTGIGLVFCVQQLGQIEAVLVESAEGIGREGAIPLFKAQVAHQAARALSDLEVLANEQAEIDAASAQRVRDQHDFVAIPFFLDENQKRFFSSTERAAVPTAPTDVAAPPPEFRHVLRLSGDEQVFTKALDRLWQDTQIADIWRMRALAKLAAIQRRSGDSEGAVQAYDRLFSHFGDLLATSEAPGSVNVLVAYAEVVESRGTEATEWDKVSQYSLYSQLKEMNRESVSISRSEIQFLLKRLKKVSILGVQPKVIEILEQREKSQSEDILARALDSALDGPLYSTRWNLTESAQQGLELVLNAEWNSPIELGPTIEFGLVGSNRSVKIPTDKVIESEESGDWLSEGITSKKCKKTTNNSSNRFKVTRPSEIA